MRCGICLRESSASPYHSRCLRRLFGTGVLPRIDIDLARLHTFALAMVGRTTMSGVQRKISVDLTGDRETLRLVIGRGHYILKPQTETFPQIPQNELVTMRLAELVEIEVPPCGLVRLSDDTLAYVVKRFDRTLTGKLRQEDFCQLAEQPPKDKYEGSAELCVRVLRRYASEPLVDLLRFFRLMVFSWWTGNGDMHLKNFSLLTGEDGFHRLSPAYDLLSTALVIPGDQLALPIAGKRDGLTRKSWLQFGEYSDIPERSVARVLATVISSLEAALAIVAASPLSDDMKNTYRELLRQRTSTLAA